MGKTRRRVFYFGDGSWRLRVLGKAASLGVQLRQKGTAHGAETDVVLEKQSQGWKRPYLTVQKGTYRDDLKVNCSVLSWDAANFVFHFKMGNLHNICLTNCVEEFSISSRGRSRPGLLGLLITYEKLRPVKSDFTGRNFYIVMRTHEE